MARVPLYLLLCLLCLQMASAVPAVGRAAAAAPLVPLNLVPLAARRWPTTLTDLPSELLQMILAYVFSSLSLRPRNYYWQASDAHYRNPNPPDATAVFLVCRLLNANAKAVFWEHIEFLLTSYRAHDNREFRGDRLFRGIRRLQRLVLAPVQAIRWDRVLHEYPKLRYLTIRPVVIVSPRSPPGPADPNQPATNILASWCSAISELRAKGSAKYIAYPEVVDVTDNTYRTRVRLFERAFWPALVLQLHFHDLCPRGLFLGNDNEDDVGTHVPGEFPVLNGHDHYQECLTKKTTRSPGCGEQDI